MLKRYYQRKTDRERARIEGKIEIFAARKRYMDSFEPGQLEHLLRRMQNVGMTSATVPHLSGLEPANHRQR